MRTAEIYKPALIVLIAAAIMTVFSNLAPASAAPATPLPQFTAGEQLKDLSKLLLGGAEFATITGGTGTPEIAGPYTDLASSAARLDNPSCASAYSPAETTSYAGSRYRDVAVTVASDDGHAMSQALVRFPDLDHIAAYASDLKTQWESCAGQVLTHTSSDGSLTHWQIGEPTITKSKAMVMPLRSDDGVICQRAVGVVGAIFIDVLACGLDATAYGETTVLAIAQKSNIRTL